MTIQRLLQLALRKLGVVEPDAQSLDDSLFHFNLIVASIGFYREAETINIDFNLSDESPFTPIENKMLITRVALSEGVVFDASQAKMALLSTEDKENTAKFYYNEALVQKTKASTPII